MTSRRLPLVVVLLAASLLAGAGTASAHGERNQEPFLRMRTIHWYDVTWSASKIAVNEELTVRGKFHVFSDWPRHLFELASVYLNLGTTGPVLVKVASYINGVPVMQSTDLEYGRDYEFELVLKGRIPGNHHVHPMLNVEDAGPLLGPGKYVEVTGDAADFVIPLRTLDGIDIPNLETWGLGRMRVFYALWLSLGVAWVLWWFRQRPLLLPRFRAIVAEREEGLVTGRDRVAAAVLVVVTLFGVAYGAVSTNAQYPRTSALQGGRVRVFPSPEDETGRMVVRHRKGVYDVPGRSLRLDLEVKNETPRPVRLGEFTAANLRFVNRSVPEAVAGVPEGYPEDLIARSGLEVRESEPLAPGETRMIHVEASDAAWETERLASLMGNPDSSYGALLFFFDDQGKRYSSEVSGPAIPVFTKL